MNLTALPIKTWGYVNFYVLGNEWNVEAGNTERLYFQIVDTDQAIANNIQGFGIFTGTSPAGTTAGLRYLLGVGSENQPYGVTVSFPSIDTCNYLTLTAVQASIYDSSIWYVTLASNQIPGSGNVLFSVQQGSTTKRFSVTNMISVNDPTSNGSC
jgi:hypothetical protein